MVHKRLPSHRTHFVCWRRWRDNDDDDIVHNETQTTLFSFWTNFVRYYNSRCVVCLCPLCRQHFMPANSKGFDGNSVFFCLFCSVPRIVPGLSEWRILLCLHEPYRTTKQLDFDRVPKTQSTHCDAAADIFHFQFVEIELMMDDDVVNGDVAREFYCKIKYLLRYISRLGNALNNIWMKNEYDAKMQSNLDANFPSPTSPHSWHTPALCRNGEAIDHDAFLFAFVMTQQRHDERILQFAMHPPTATDTGLVRFFLYSVHVAIRNRYTFANAKNILTQTHTMNEVDEVPENGEVRIRFHCIQCMANGSCFTNETVQKHFVVNSDILPDTSLHIFHSLQVKIHDKRIQRDMQSSHHRAQHRQRHIPAATESCSGSWFSHTATAHCDVGKMEIEKKKMKCIGHVAWWCNSVRQWGEQISTKCTETDCFLQNL